ncbi:MAG: AMP-binding protein [Bdellovibrionales bacterium]|nr:AMP-binding protein [Bdellovibrionales bacterium]
MSKNLMPLETFCNFENIYGDTKVYLKQPLNGTWKDYSWKEVGQEARKLAAAIRKMDLPEKSCIGLISKNCAHWIITDLAIWMSGHISVPLYPTLTTGSIDQIVDHSEAKLLFVGKLDEWDSQLNGLKSDIKRVHFPFWENKDCESWESFVGDCAPLMDFSFPKPDDVATIIYTSGTTGMPKGVVHTFDSISFPAREALGELGFCSTDRFISYLPLSHIAERLLIEIGALYGAGTVFFAESLDTFKDNLQEASPTVFLAVPRIWLKFQQGILAKVPQKKLNTLLSIPILGGLIKKKIRKQLGLNDVRVPITGAAPIAADLLKWFSKLDINVMEVYGMTENFGLATFNFPGRVKFGSVGESWSNGEVKIDNNGEILTKSAATMKGYYKEEGKTKEVLGDDGWLRTGDKGEFDDYGYLKITGRVKDLFKTSKGKYVAPNPIEKHFTMSEVIEQVCVVGAGLPAPFAITVLSEIGMVKKEDELKNIMSALLLDVNNKVEHYERLSKVVVLKDEWSTETGILTPTMKIKRNVLEKKYEIDIERWDSLKESVVFN